MRQNNNHEDRQQLLVELDPSPKAIDIQTPCFSWAFPVADRGVLQTAYHLLVATSPALLKAGKPDMWDSGLVKSNESVQVLYAGRPLASNTDYSWQVRVCLSSGEFGDWSRVAEFSTAFLDKSEWTAKWIGSGSPNEPIADPNNFNNPPVNLAVAAFEPEMRSPMLRKEFSIGKSVARARVFVCGLGLYELALNGSRVGDIIMTPQRTDFRKRVYYDTYDVTDALNKGSNAFGILLGNGWFNSDKKYWGWRMQWFGSPRVILQMVVEYKDGSRETIITDDTWKTSFGPLIFNSIYEGEDYDARLEQPGWDAPGFNDSAWTQANIVPSPGGVLCSAMQQPDRVTEIVKPVGLKEPSPRVFVFDMGQNFTGTVKLKVSGPTGAAVKLRFGEGSLPDGNFDRKTLNKARAEINYTLKGEGVEIHTPRFTYCGFNFVEVTGYPGKPGLDAIEGLFYHTDLARHGEFECASPDMMHIHDCMIRSQRGNLQMGVPTDNTQRPERLGWGADAWASAPQAMYNFDTPRFYIKWLRDFLDQQFANGMVGHIVPVAASDEDLVWSCAYVFLPWWQYGWTGDKRLLLEHYPALVRYMDFLATRGRDNVEESPEGVFPLQDKDQISKMKPGYLQASMWGDHLSVAKGFRVRSGLPISMTTAFYYQDIRIMEKMATVLGNKKDAEKYAALAELIRDAFNKKWFHPETGCYDNGTQLPQALALAFGLVPQDREQAVLQSLLKDLEEQDWHLTTGYAGTLILVEALEKYGRHDVVWRLANQKSYPSWLFMLQGKNTVPEEWNGQNGSWNHHALVSPIDAWFYSTLAGIRYEESAPGFSCFTIKPYIPTDLEWARGAVETVRGLVSSSWRKERKTLILTITIPYNSTAMLYVPALTPDSVKEGGKSIEQAGGLEFISLENGASVLRVGAGTYNVTVCPFLTDFS